MGSAKPLSPIYPSDAARFIELVDDSGGPDACWHFFGGKVNGYGSFRHGKRKVYAHRFAWKLWSGQPEPDPALHLDHTCHNPAECVTGCTHRACVNPAHLRPSTPAQNVANSNARSKQLAQRTHCRHGHEFTPENTYRHPSNPGRMCKECRRQACAKQYVSKGRGKRPDFDTHCINGHLWADFARTNSQFNRVCQQCDRESKRRAYERRKAATRR